jgi:hypothetical protein
MATTDEEIWAHANALARERADALAHAAADEAARVEADITARAETTMHAGSEPHEAGTDAGYSNAFERAYQASLHGGAGQEAYEATFKEMYDNLLGQAYADAREAAAIADEHGGDEELLPTDAHEEDTP